MYARASSVSPTPGGSHMRTPFDGLITSFSKRSVHGMQETRAAHGKMFNARGDAESRIGDSVSGSLTPFGVNSFSPRSTQDFVHSIKTHHKAVHSLPWHLHVIQQLEPRVRHALERAQIHALVAAEP